MKNLFLFLSFLFFNQLFSQKKYHFDYAFIIKESYKLNNKKINSVYLVNSKHNNINLYAHDGVDSLNYSLHFKDENGVAFNGSIDKTDFNKVETIVNTCNEVRRYVNPYINKRKQYEFVNYQDTLIDNVSFYHYAIKCNKKLKYQKRKKIVTIHYIVDKSDSNFLPFTYLSTIYETWRISKNIPNGYPKTIFFINSDGKETGRMEFIKVIKVDKYTAIPDECDFTNEEIRKRKTNLKISTYQN